MELKWMLFGLLMLADLFFLAAVISKYIEVKRASTWIAAEAKIVSSRSEARKVDKSSGTGRDRVVDHEMRNFAVVQYCFKVNGEVKTGDRISIGHDIGNYQVAEKLARYPVGKTVTVFYDPAKPSNNVLERDIATRSFEIAILVGALIAVVAMFFMSISSDMSGWLTWLLPASGQQSAGLFLTSFAAFAALFGYTLYQRGRATLAWPAASGMVLRSSVDTVQIRWFNEAGAQRIRNAFRGRTIYDYKVNGVAYQSDRVSYGGQIYATFRLLARRSALQFTGGDTVDVFYNPLAPAEAVLVRGAPGQWLIWLVVLGALIGAGKLMMLY